MQIYKIQMQNGPLKPYNPGTQPFKNKTCSPHLGPIYGPLKLQWENDLDVGDVVDKVDKELGRFAQP